MSDVLDIALVLLAAFGILTAVRTQNRPAAVWALVVIILTFRIVLLKLERP
jgi:uncharacterized protein with PQ loop repeat